VVTEALFAVARGGSERAPTELVLLTTQEGAALARETLLDPADGALARLAREWEWPWLGALPVRLVVADPKSPTAEQAEIADVALGLLHELCDDPDAMVHVILTGGRKTAAAATALAMALVARAGPAEPCAGR
jgi:CRISPR-associated protein (TIGR02584 family)